MNSCNTIELFIKRNSEEVESVYEADLGSWMSHTVKGICEGSYMGPNKIYNTLNLDKPFT